MTPRDVDELAPAEYRALSDYANREIKRHNRESKRASRRR